MGIFCIVFGIIIIVGFALLGHVTGIALGLDSFFNVLGGNAQLSIMDFLKIPGADKLATYLVCLAIFLFLGLTIGLGLVMNGMVYNKLESVERISRRAARRNKRRIEE